MPHTNMRRGSPLRHMPTTSNHRRIARKTMSQQTSSYIHSILAVFGLDHRLEIVVTLGANAHGLAERRCSDWQDHELLHRQLVPRMRSTVDDIQRWHRHHPVVVFVSRQRTNVPLMIVSLHTITVTCRGHALEQRHALLRCSSLADGHGNAQDSVRTELVCVPIKL